MSRSDHIRITRTTVVKSGTPAVMAVEVEKTRRAGRIGKATGLFRVPEVLDFDESRGVAVFERLEGIETLFALAPSPRRYLALAERIGLTLAAVHRDLVLPPEMTIPLPPEFAAEGHDVYLHGDPSVENILLERKSGALVILDWQMTDVHGGLATYGCRYFDLLWFVNNLIWSPTLRHFFYDPTSPVAKRFIGSYYRAAGLPPDPEDLARYAARFFEVKLPRRGKDSRRDKLYVPRGRYLSDRFVRALRKDLWHD